MSGGPETAEAGDNYRLVPGPRLRVGMWRQRLAPAVAAAAWQGGAGLSEGDRWPGVVQEVPLGRSGILRSAGRRRRRRQRRLQRPSLRW